jgi:hypothetical protein
MLPRDHARRGEFEALTQAEEGEGLYTDTATIGFKLNWERLLEERGLYYQGHELKRRDGRPPRNRPPTGEPTVHRHKTALVRYELSKPVRTLLEYGLLRSDTTFFDYGCGLGADIKGLLALGHQADGWDLYGDVRQADLIKFHKASGKVTFLLYDDFENRPLPELRLRIKVNLRTRWVQAFDHSAQGQLLYFKERFLEPEHPDAGAMRELTAELQRIGVQELDGLGPSKEMLRIILERANFRQLAARCLPP